MTDFLLCILIIGEKFAKTCTQDYKRSRNLGVDMLYRLEIQNFGSVKLPQVVDLRIGSGVPPDAYRFPPLFRGSSDRAPLVIALFGPNASGKSTVLKALSFIAWFIQHSFQLAPNAALPCEPFNDPEGSTNPIRLGVEFGGLLDPIVHEESASLNDWGTWRYELALTFKEERLIVYSENLRQRTRGRGKWVRVFEREGQNVRASKVFGLSGFGKVIDKVRDNASVIATLAQFEHSLSLKLRNAASSVFGNIALPNERAELSDPDVVASYASYGDLLAALNKDIQRIDLGIRQMTIQQLPTGPVAMFDHEGLSRPMPWQLESHGTRNFIKYFPLLEYVLSRGGVAIVDEIDISIHPLVLPEIVRWFHNPERNKKAGQLWMSCHAASLLEELQKEEIFFCEKDGRGRTSVYGLQDIQNVRRTDNRYRKYLSGVYGAVPRFG